MWIPSILESWDIRMKNVLLVNRILKDHLQFLKHLKPKYSSVEGISVIILLDSNMKIITPFLSRILLNGN